MDQKMTHYIGVAVSHALKGMHGYRRPEPYWHTVMQEVEKQLLVHAAEACRGDQSAMSRRLGLNRMTVRKKCLEYGVSVQTRGPRADL